MHIEQNHCLVFSMCFLIYISDSVQINHYQGNSGSYIHIAGLIFYAMLWLHSVLLCLLPTEVYIPKWLRVRLGITHLVKIFMISRQS